MHAAYTLAQANVYSVLIKHKYRYLISKEFFVETKKVKSAFIKYDNALMNADFIETYPLVDSTGPIATSSEVL